VKFSLLLNFEIKKKITVADRREENRRQEKRPPERRGRELLHETERGKEERT
jgi:hypothetical protein